MRNFVLSYLGRAVPRGNARAWKTDHILQVLFVYFDQTERTTFRPIPSDDVALDTLERAIGPVTVEEIRACVRELVMSNLVAVTPDTWEWEHARLTFKGAKYVAQLLARNEG